MGTMAVEREVEAAPMHRLEGQLCFALYSVTNVVGRTYAPLLGALGLTYPQYIVMLVLWEQDGVSVGSIGRRLFLDSGTLTPLLKRLEQNGLIERRRDTADERQVRISLTAAGQALRERARDLPQALGCAMGRGLDDLAALRDDLLRLRASLMASLDGAAAPGPGAADLSPALVRAPEPSSASGGARGQQGENDAR